LPSPAVTSLPPQPSGNRPVPRELSAFGFALASPSPSSEANRHLKPAADPPHARRRSPRRSPAVDQDRLQVAGPPTLPDAFHAERDVPYSARNHFDRSHPCSGRN